MWPSVAVLTAAADGSDGAAVADGAGVGADVVGADVAGVAAVVAAERRGD